MIESKIVVWVKKGLSGFFHGPPNRVVSTRETTVHSDLFFWNALWYSTTSLFFAHEMSLSYFRFLIRSVLRRQERAEVIYLGFNITACESTSFSTVFPSSRPKHMTLPVEDKIFSASIISGNPKTSTDWGAFKHVSGNLLVNVINLLNCMTLGF